jgi:ParB family transcriptional regulator, chromosome partitioning protein
MTCETINKQLKLEYLDISLSCLRILQPADLERIYQSLRRLGQLNPVIVRKEGNGYQILDGFKRYFGAERIGWPCLDARVLDISISHGVAMMLNYNRTSRSLMDYDEALVVYSLKKDHLMDQSSISQLTGYSRSWVCRRLALIEKLAFSVQQELRMGMISNSQARAIVKLPRGNQEDIMRVIISHGITSRDSSVLVESFLRSNSKSGQEYIINHPVEVIEQSSHNDEIYDQGLAWHGNRLFKSIEQLIALQNIFIAQFTHHHTRELKEIEQSMLPGKLEMVEKNASTIVSIIKNKTLIQ